MRAKIRFFGFGACGGLARFIGIGFRGALLIDCGGFISRCLFGGSLRGLLLRDSGGGGLLGFLFLARGIGGGFFRFLLHANGFGLGGFRLQASLLGVLAALDFSGGLFFGSFFLGGDFGLRVLFGFLFYGHHARFFRGFDNFARGGFDRFFLALAAVDVFGVFELLLGSGQRRGGVFVGLRDARDANGVARFEEFERRFAVDAEDGVFDFRVGRGIDAASQQFVLASMFSTFPCVAGPRTFSRTTMLPGCVTAKYGSAVTIMPKVCMSEMALTWPLPFLRATSPRFTARPCGETAQSTYVRYSRPNLVASSKPWNLASISMRLLLLSTLASPEAPCISSVP